MVDSPTPGNGSGPRPNADGGDVIAFFNDLLAVEPKTNPEHGDDGHTQSKLGAIPSLTEEMRHSAEVGLHCLLEIHGDNYAKTTRELEEECGGELDKSDLAIVLLMVLGGRQTPADKKLELEDRPLPHMLAINGTPFEITEVLALNDMINRHDELPETPWEHSMHRVFARGKQEAKIQLSQRYDLRGEGDLETRALEFCQFIRDSLSYYWTNEQPITAEAEIAIDQFNRFVGSIADREYEVYKLSHLRDIEAALRDGTGSPLTMLVVEYARRADLELIRESGV